MPWGTKAIEQCRPAIAALDVSQRPGVPAVAGLRQEADQPAKQAVFWAISAWSSSTAGGTSTHASHHLTQPFVTISPSAHDKAEKRANLTCASAKRPWATFSRSTAAASAPLAEVHRFATRQYPWFRTCIALRLATTGYEQRLRGILWSSFGLCTVVSVLLSIARTNPCYPDSRLPWPSFPYC